MTRKLLKDLIDPQCTCMGVGSFPFNDPKEALTFLARRPHILSFWPELPQKNKAERMLERSERALQENWQGYIKEESSMLFEIKKQYKDSSTSFGLLKCQVMGPLSLLLYSSKLKGDFTTKLSSALSVCLKQIEWLHGYLQEVADNLLFVIDEPGLVKWFELSAEEQNNLLEAYTYLFVRVSEAKAYLGMHSCAAFTAKFLDFPIELYSFDLLEQNFEEVFADELCTKWQAFFKKGAVLCPGVFPSSCEEDMEDILVQGHVLLSRINAYLDKLGIENEYRILWSAACGHSASSIDWLCHLYEPI